MNTKRFTLIAVMSVALLGLIDNASATKAMATPAAFDNNGASTAVFSIAAGRTVHFSRGNLQYQASTGTWRFAETQWGYTGEANTNISSSCTDWIDLFGWGTSGFSGSGAKAYQPWAVSTEYADYCIGGNPSNNMTAKSDWGVFNAISNGGNKAGMWRTLTKEEWYYLLFKRKGSRIQGDIEARFAKATVCGVKGIMIFPDTYKQPAGMGDLKNVNDNFTDYSGNVITADAWQQLEAAGVVFLPAAGARFDTELDGIGENGAYWSSTSSADGAVWLLHFDDNDLHVGDNDRSYGFSVRLVRD